MIYTLVGPYENYKSHRSLIAESNIANTIKANFIN